MISTYQGRNGERVVDDPAAREEVVDEGAHERQRDGLDGRDFAEELERRHAVLLLEGPDELAQTKKRESDD